MPPLKSQLGVKKYTKVTIIPPSKKRPKSFFEEYYYAVLVVEFTSISILFTAGGMTFYEGTLVGLLCTALTAVAWQFRQFAKYGHEPAPARGLKAKAKPAENAEKLPNPDFVPIRPAPRKPAPIGPDGKKKFPPSYFPPLRDRKPQQ
jgi:hypothetical protein